MKNTKRKVENNVMKEPRNPHLSPVYAIVHIARQYVDSLEYVSPNHCILQSLTAILCHFLSLHNRWHTKNCQKNAFLHKALPFTSVCDLISILSSSPHLCTPSSARKYWTLNCLWSWWELRIPSTFQDGVRKVNKKLSPSKLFLQQLIAFQIYGLFALSGSMVLSTAQRLQNKWRKGCSFLFLKENC